MVTIKTTKEIRLEDFTGDFIVEEIERYWGYKWALVEEQKKELNSYFIPLEKAGDIHYGHRNDTIEMAYLRGRNEIINELRKVLFGDE